MNATENVVTVGTKMIYVARYGEKPSVWTVTKVTPTGRVYIDAVDLDSAQWIPTIWACEYKRVGAGHRKSERLHVYSDEKMAELTDEYERCDAERKAMIDRSDRERRERDERREQEIAETRAAFLVTGRAIAPDFFRMQVLPDKSRLYSIDMPIRPEMAENKKFEVLVVRVKDLAQPSWQGPEYKVEAAFTYFDAKGVSFPSVPTERFVSDEAALVEFCRAKYFSW